MESIIPSKTYPALTASFVCIVIVGKTIAMSCVVAIRNPLQTRLTKSRNYSIYLEFRREFFIYFAIEHSKT